MAIKTGRYGRVRYAPPPTPDVASLVEIISLNAWTLSLKTDYDEVTCFGDTNKVYVPGMRDVSGTIGGFWNSDERTLFDATEATEPGLLELAPNENDGAGGPPVVIPAWSGLGYMDADINCAVNAAPKVSGNFRAAGPWTLTPP